LDLIFADTNYYCYTSTQNTCTRLVQIDYVTSTNAHSRPRGVARDLLNRQRSRHSFFVIVCLLTCLVLRYNKTNGDWRANHYWKFSL